MASCVTSTIPIVIGKGIAWGIGLHQIPHDIQPTNIKQEGDGKLPAGIFTISGIFARDTYLADHPELQPLFAKAPQRVNNTYIVTPAVKAGDDPRSVYYNQIIDKAMLIKKGKQIDWQSDENMHAENVRVIYI